MSLAVVQAPTTPISQPRPVPDRAQAEAFIATIMQPGSISELRIPKPKKGSPRRLWGVASGYFDDPAACASEAASITGADAEGVYVTVNPVDPDLLARACNRLKDGRPATTTDDQILAYRHILIDIDPVYPSGISATEDERQHAIAKRDEVRAFLVDQLRWPEPLYVGSSGNGGTLIYRFAAANSPETIDLVRGGLVALSAIFTDQHAKIDTTTFNPARLVKIPGTIAAKGDHVPSRPHRLATGLVNPTVETVPLERLSALAVLAPEPATPTGTESGRSWNLRDVLESSDVGFHTKERGGSTIYVLDRCLTSEDHRDGACIIERPDGKLLYVCHHDRCRGKRWQDARTALQIPTPMHQPSASVVVSPQAHNPVNISPRIAEDEWPRLDLAALYGLAGDVVGVLAPHTEADEVALLVSSLVMFGNACGRTPHLMIGDDRHGANVFTALVGDTSKARKGTSQGGPRRILSLADAEWERSRVLGGIGSGEGIIHAIRDAVSKQNKAGEWEVIDPGVTDKRLLAVEEEFAAIFKIGQRIGSTASETIRRAWDSRPVLQSVTKNSPSIATNPHVSMLCHITKDELRRCLTETDVANGLANRFAWFLVRRSKALAMPRRIDESDAADLARQVGAALSFARRTGEFALDDAAMAMWEEVYPSLSEGKPGLYGALVARGEAITLRFALIHALLDQSRRISPDHLSAALALWDYAEASARFLVGKATGDPNADRIYAYLSSTGEEVPKTAIYELFDRNVGRREIDRCLEVLIQARLAASRQGPSMGGRPSLLWRAIA